MQLVLRGAALLLASTAVMPSYSSQALVDFERYIGNPLPLIDPIVALVAMAAALRPPFARWAGGVGLVSSMLTFGMLLADSAEGIEVRVEYGPMLSLALSLLLIVTQLFFSRTSRSSAVP